MKQHIHFIGFRKNHEWLSATMVWGQPDFVHHWHDHRMYGDVGDTDILIFASKARPDVINPYTWQDHEQH